MNRRGAAPRAARGAARRRSVGTDHGVSCAPTAARSLARAWPRRGGGACRSALRRVPRCVLHRPRAPRPTRATRPSRAKPSSMFLRAAASSAICARSSTMPESNVVALPRVLTSSCHTATRPSPSSNVQRADRLASMSSCRSEPQRSITSTRRTWSAEPRSTTPSQSDEPRSVPAQRRREVFARDRARADAAAARAARGLDADRPDEAVLHFDLSGLELDGGRRRAADAAERGEGERSSAARPRAGWWACRQSLFCQQPGDRSRRYPDVTSGGGYYLFDDLYPGDYVISVAASNFSGAGVLTGYWLRRRV